MQVLNLVRYILYRLLISTVPVSKFCRKVFSKFVAVIKVWRFETPFDEKTLHICNSPTNVQDRAEERGACTPAHDSQQCGGENSRRCQVSQLFFFGHCPLCVARDFLISFLHFTCEISSSFRPPFQK